MSAPFDVIISRLDGIRPYLARSGLVRAVRAFCPAHQSPPHKRGRGRTLSVAEKQNGAVLVRCHSGCAAADVLAGVGLSLSDLYPRGAEGDHRRAGDPRGPSAWASAAAAADSLAEAALIVAIEPTHQAISLLLTSAGEFSSLARAAMRGEGG